MKLRTQILVSLFLFAFTPLFVAFIINLPLVLDRFERFYHEAHTQNLRADFRDLDQHRWFNRLYSRKNQSVSGAGKAAMLRDHRNFSDI